ncbi:MAG: aldose 1-epimerase family protein [Fuerstiella sp.]
MARSFTLFNVDEGIYATARIDSQSADIDAFGDQWSVSLHRLHGGLSDGVDVIWLNNGQTRLAVLPTRGMGIWKGEVAGVPLEWRSPVERPVHPAFVDQMRRGGIGWLDGFNELICRCGLGWHGAPGTDVIKDSDGNVISEQFLPLHGRIANLPAHQVTVEIDDDGLLSLTGVVDEASVFGGRLRLTSTLKTRIGSNTFEILDTVENPGSATAEVEMLYHCNIGRPFLQDGAGFHSAVEEVAPRDARAAEGIDDWNQYAGPVSGYAEQVYFTKPVSGPDGRGLALLKNAAGDKAISVSFSTDTLPWLALWKNTQAEEDGYCTGLEPCSSFPNLKTFERQHGRVISLAAGDSVSFELSFSVALDKADVDAIVDDISTMQNGHKVKIGKEPNPDWSPA